MGIFDVFSGRSGRLASMATAQQLQQTQAQVQQLLQQGKGDALAAIDAGQPLSLDALKTGYGRAGGTLNDAAALYNPYATTGRAGFDMYANANGLGGPAGNEAAVGAFRASPGYQWSVDQSTDALARKAASLGGAAGGNTMAAISDRAGHMADAEYGGWLSRLQGIGQTGYNATGAQAGLMGQRAGMEAQEGVGTAGIYDANARARAGIHTGSTALGAGSLMDMGKMLASNTTAGMTAGQTAGANQINAMMQAGALLAKLLGQQASGAGDVLSKGLPNLTGASATGDAVFGMM